MEKDIERALQSYSVFFVVVPNPSLSQITCSVVNSAVSVKITVTQKGSSSHGIYAFESQITSNPTSITFSYSTAKKRSTVTVTSTEVNASYDVECGDGAGLVGKECLTCPAGSYSSGGVCEKCSVGSYQPNSGKTQCTSCDTGLTTVTTGSDSITDCTGLCLRGFQTNTLSESLGHNRSNY